MSPRKLEPQDVEEAFAFLVQSPAGDFTFDPPWRDGRRHRNEGVEKPLLESLYINLGVTRTTSNRGAWFHPESDLINLPHQPAYYATGDNSAIQRYYRTFTHELVHYAVSRILPHVRV